MVVASNLLEKQKPKINMTETLSKLSQAYIGNLWENK